MAVIQVQGGGDSRKEEQEEHARHISKEKISDLVID